MEVLGAGIATDGTELILSRIPSGGFLEQRLPSKNGTTGWWEPLDVVSLSRAEALGQVALGARSCGLPPCPQASPRDMSWVWGSVS